MTETLSLSLFTIESDLKPIYTFAAKWQRDAEIYFRDETLRTKLHSARVGGQAICDDYSILRFRLANADERTLFRQKLATRPTEEATGIFLVDVD
jgi:hypothetical protein